MNSTITTDIDEMGLMSGLRRLGEVAPTGELRANVLTTLNLADRYFQIDTVAGPVFIAHNARGVSYVVRVSDVEDFEAEFRHNFGRPAFGVARPPDQLVHQVERVLQGETRHVPPIDLAGQTEFVRSVLLKALEIPYGQVRPYSWIARQIGHPNAQRAVGSALAGNPVPLLIPCHRVVRRDGLIGNYGLGGPEIKRRILEYEGANIDRLEGMARRGHRYIGSDTTHIYCFPTCHHGHRLTEKHTVEFASTQEAQAKGYRPCKVCRPE